LALIMLGLHEPTNGEIKVDDVDLKRFGQRNYRKHVCAVMQDDRLYLGTIFENISSFSTVPDENFLKKCAKIAQIHNTIIRKTMGYNSIIGQMNSSLSGGETQRILLARALYKKPKLLIMDEASSNLDIKTEIAINKSIASLNITRIIFAHRPQTIRNADKVYKLTPSGLISLSKRLINRVPNDP